MYQDINKLIKLFGGNRMTKKFKILISCVVSVTFLVATLGILGVTYGVTRDNFSRHMTSFMQDHQLPPKQMARLLGISVPAVNRLCSRVKPPTNELITRFKAVNSLDSEQVNNLLERIDREEIRDGIGAFLDGAKVGGITAPAVYAIGQWYVWGSVFDRCATAAYMLKNCIMVSLAGLTAGGIVGVIVHQSHVEKQLSENEVNPRWEGDW